MMWYFCILAEQNEKKNDRRMYEEIILYIYEKEEKHTKTKTKIYVILYINKNEK